MMRLLFIILFVFNLSLLSAQDTLRVMHYNLLDYGNAGFCSNSTNNTDQKDAYLRSIISYAKPDIFTVNEISDQAVFQERLLSEVLNQAGYALFNMAASPNIADSYIVNQLYYNSERLALHSQVVAQSELRDIDVYRLYYLSDNLQNGDTLFIYCIVAHLKAGSGSDDEARRELMTSNALEYLEENGRPGNYLFMGDFNVYESTDDAFQLMITNNDPVFRFYDPIDEIGDWHNSYDYQHVHTQSTRGSNSGCGASGGMDDRFDFILSNQILHDHADKVSYLEGSYHAMGQDGNRLNGTIKDPPNTSLPAYIIDALYGMSDHLPVIMDLVVDGSLDISEGNVSLPQLKVNYQNPASRNLKLRISSPYKGKASLSLYSASGISIYHDEVMLDRKLRLNIPIDTVPPGMYILKIDHEKVQYSGKVMIIP